MLEVLVRHQCAGCHSVQSVFGGADDAFAAPAPEGEGARHAPALSSMERFRAGWLRAFLKDPGDLRPNLPEAMPRPELTAAELELLVTDWRAQPDESAGPPPAPAQLASGAALFAQKQCGACHDFGAPGLRDDLASTERLRALAPELRHARERLSRSTVERFIFSPAAVKPTTQMPRTPLTPDEARALADYIYFAPLPPAPLRAPSAS